MIFKIYVINLSAIQIYEGITTFCQNKIQRWITVRIRQVFCRLIFVQLKRAEIFKNRYLHFQLISFAHQYHCSRCFKEKFEVAPREFRKKMQRAKIPLPDSLLRGRCPPRFSPAKSMPVLRYPLYGNTRDAICTNPSLRSRPGQMARRGSVTPSLWKKKKPNYRISGTIIRLVTDPLVSVAMYMPGLSSRRLTV